ncbi:putative thioredoxin reductase-like protein 2 [Colletotrichum chlorophyti]|uniref:Putative thioredoxin reductase-like protein 2 n=1 Tax=Colletotrichum chlorophyti TaxID=708187 RepID=A0A1Q8S6I6_9PEZI|nr:putative thioredoxin reductase-like protein 2 [Colletotrichum chlorophyti]
MKFSLRSLVLSALLPQSLVLALPLNDTVLYDAIIIGGGPAGLAAASALGRVRRNALLIDSGEYRNAPTRHMHDVLGFDGVTPAWYRYAARQQISHYKTITFTNGTVTKIDGNDADNFVVTTQFSEDNAIKKVRARKIVLATGLRDILPSTPGLLENWGKGIFWCPWCDGTEHADQAMGLLASSFDDLPSLAREILTLNTDIIAFANGTDTPEARAATEKKNPKFQEYLDLHNITVENRTIKSITRLRDGSDPAHDPSLPTAPEHDLFRVDFTEGEPVERAAFFISFPDEQRSKIGEQAGVQLWGGRLAADNSKGLITNVPGIYAIGDANSDNSTNVPHALYTGKRTAVSLHVKLAKEDQAKETGVNVTLLRRDDDIEQRSLWDIANGPAGEILYAGEFDQKF